MTDRDDPGNRSPERAVGDSGGPPGDGSDNGSGGGSSDPAHRQRLAIRAGAAVVAVVLVTAAAWILLADRRPSRSIEAYCAKVQGAEALRGALATGDAQEIQAAVGQFRGAAQVAPVDIESATQVLVDYADGLSATLDTAGGSEAETRAALADAVRRQDARSDDVVAAGRAVDAYAREHCGFEPNGTTPSTG